MARPPSAIPLAPGVLVRFYEADLAKLRRLFPRAGYNRAVREIINVYLSQITEDTTWNQANPTLAELEATIQQQLAGQ